MTSTPAHTPVGELLSAAAGARLLGISRTRFWQLRKQFGLQRVAWSTETRPLYRRDDVLALADRHRWDNRYLLNADGEPLYGLDTRTGKWYKDTPIPREPEG